MSKSEFRELVKEFFEWTSQGTRPASSWFLSLENWAASKYNACVEEEQRNAHSAEKQ